MLVFFYILHSFFNVGSENQVRTVGDRVTLSSKAYKNFYKGILMYLLTSERLAGLQNKHTYYIRTLLEAIESLKSFYRSSLISLIIWNRFGVFAQIVLVRSS